MFNAEFKAALALLPSKEKDKLLWRLIKRDELLARRLEYELLAPYDAVDKRDELAELIQDRIIAMAGRRERLSVILSQFRRFSGDITRHVYVTKDKVGEITLNFILLQQAMRLLNNTSYMFGGRAVQKYIVYMLNKLYRTCMLVHKLHIDYHIELEDDAQKLGEIMQANLDLMKYVNHHKFNVDWLIDFDIPEDLDEHYKAVRQQGLLR
ncbi:MAG: hypothetical protein GX921_03505 [Bacteroidales bacterium]|nr:hypothetical protein [Bacteroidales bacterium]